MMLRQLIFATLVSTLTLIAESPNQWKQGRLVDLSAGTQSRVVGVNGRITTQYRRFTYSVDAGDKVYEAEEIGKAPNVEVNSAVEFYVSKDHLYIKDLDAKVHKLALVKTTRKE